MHFGMNVCAWCDTFYRCAFILDNGHWQSLQLVFVFAKLSRWTNNKGYEWRHNFSKKRIEKQLRGLQDARPPRPSGTKISELSGLIKPWEICQHSIRQNASLNYLAVSSVFSGRGDMFRILLAPKVLWEDLWRMITIHPSHRIQPTYSIEDDLSWTKVN